MKHFSTANYAFKYHLSPADQKEDRTNFVSQVRTFVVRLMPNLLRALHESRSEQAQREIYRLRHLISTDAVKYQCNHQSSD